MNKMIVTSKKHKLANDLSSGTTCLIFVNRLFFKLVVTYKYDKHCCIDGLHHTMSLFTSDAMAGTLDVYFINKDILSFQLLASVSVLPHLTLFTLSPVCFKPRRRRRRRRRFISHTLIIYIT